MNTTDLVKRLMEQDRNWMTDDITPVIYFYTMQAAIENKDEFMVAFSQIRQQPPLPLGEWFTATTKRAYCVQCGEWQPVTHSPAKNISCAKCGYWMVVYASGRYISDGDEADNFVWIASKHRYVHVDDLGQDLPPVQDEPAYTSEGEPTDYPKPHRLPEWVLAAILEDADTGIRTLDLVAIEPTLRPSTFTLANEVDNLPPLDLALQALRAVDAWLATQPQEVFESMGTGVAYAMQKAIQGLSGELKKEVE